MSKAKRKDGFVVLDFIRAGADGDRWYLPEYLTVALWREAQRAALFGGNKHSLRQFRWATILLDIAKEHGVPEDARLLPWLDEHEPPPPSAKIIPLKDAAPPPQPAPEA
jgi:hypothetical protein